MGKPTIVWVHGSWHSPEHYHNTTSLLEQAGYKIVYVLEPTTHAETDRASKDISHDVHAIRSVIEAQLDAGTDVVLFLHSYATVPGFPACEGLSTSSREAAGKTTSVTGIAAVAGPVVPPGVTGKQLFGGKLPTPCKVENGLSLPEDPIGLLYADMPREDAERYVNMLKGQSVAIHEYPCPDMFTSVKDIPIRYLVCKQDHTIPIEAAKKVVGALEGAGLNISADEIDASHSPFITRPEQTALFVRKVAQENVDTGLEKFEV